MKDNIEREVCESMGLQSITVDNITELCKAVAWQLYIQETKGCLSDLYKSWDAMPERIQEFYLRKVYGRRGVIIKKEI